jgi:hypothetical protein
MGLEYLPDIPDVVVQRDMALIDAYKAGPLVLKEADFAADWAWLKVNRPGLYYYIDVLTEGMVMAAAPADMSAERRIKYCEFFQKAFVRLLTVVGDALEGGDRRSCGGTC